jgi:putative solute:sodium symporter small subunit
MPASKTSQAKAYWKENIRIVLSLLAIWFLVSFGMAILFVDVLDNFRFFGFKFGFWMAQQGSIFCFVLLIFVYVYKMNRLDHKYGVDEDRDQFSQDDTYYHSEEPEQ